MAEEDEKKKLEAASSGEPDDMEKALAKLEHEPPVTGVDPGKQDGEITPDTAGEGRMPTHKPVIKTLPEKGTDLVACQWFMGDRRFCDKIKKNVHCEGNISRCPFCK